MHRDLQGFIRLLEKQGELARVDAPVSAELEITEIADRVSKAGGSALLFTNVAGSEYPLLINAMGSEKRMALALGGETPEEIGARIGGYLRLSDYLSLQGLIGSVPRLLRLLYALPLKRRLRRGRCQEVVEPRVDLDKLPVLKCWPQDAGRFFTLPLVFTRDRDTGRQNVGMYRMQMLDRDTTAMHWHKHKDGSRIYQSYAERGERMPVSVALGCDPAITYAATAPLPPEIDEMLLAGWLRRSNVRLVKCRTNELWVPENAEFVLEGYVDPEEPLALEGPFGDHTGYYSLADFYPKFHVACVTHRKKPVYPATVVGRPPMEDCYMAKATERIFLPFLRMQIPELADLNLPLEGVFHNCALVSVKNCFPGAARKVMNALWGMGQMMYTKLIVAVDEETGVRDLHEVLGAVLRTARRDRLFLCPGPLDALDHSSSLPLYGTRLGIDATAVGSAGGDTPDFHVLMVDKKYPGGGRKALEEFLKGSRERFAVAVDADGDPTDSSWVLWKLFNNVDAGRDLVYRGDKIGVDATKKLREEGLTRDWPEDIRMSPEVKRRVEERWEEYGIYKAR